ncbi:ABC transporter ATP-binding protein [Natronocalculus amylovorans]|uniref:Molybdate/tungstate import ATP-binding protein WtpC n=1 Tax=Natronocalculus amylovorans TaxID=2917812 RepID=A0AAE3FY12_9EURY|nr:ABC transporter ATP-binding protein [Natronocalculus amylovorans]MCL9817381.1 ABC transporter ATP-binding protein [Natronocalculus amylovorans]
MASNTFSRQQTAQHGSAGVRTESSVTDPVLSLREVTKSFGDEIAVDGIDLDVERGELLTLLGPSGCGKTTTLRMIAGLEEPTAGEITLADASVAGNGSFTPPEKRDVGIVFQSFALFPHLTVSENIAFGLTDLDQDSIDERVTALLELVDLPSHGDKRPEQLSGGQKQRVALARSLAPEPELLLLDEPFSNLDVRLRVEMREEVRSILKEAGVTAVSVTHDQEEALSISDRVAVMNNGQVEQIGRPELVFEQPESRFVASFLGRASFLSSQLSGDSLETGIGTFDAKMLEGYNKQYDGIKVDVLVRPDDLRATTAIPEETNGRVVSRQYVGPSFIYRVDLDSGDTVHCLHNHAVNFAVEERVKVQLVADHSLAWYPQSD